MTDYQGLVYGLDEQVYHRQPGLSSTGAKKILQSPGHYQEYVSSPAEVKDAFDLGSAVHSKVLGVGAQMAVYPDGDGAETFEYDGKTLTNVLASNGAVSTNAARAFGEDARSRGLIPVKRIVARVVNRMAESVLAHDEARASLEGGDPEVSLFATDPDTDVALRGRFDYLGSRITDLKTTSGEASETGFARVFFRLGYHVQFGHYSHIYDLITGHAKQWLWIVVEDSAPYVTNVFALDRDERKMGMALAKRARERYARCRDSGVWPARYENRTGGRVGLLKAPTYEINDFIDSEAVAA